MKAYIRVEKLPHTGGVVIESDSEVPFYAKEINLTEQMIGFIDSANETHYYIGDRMWRGRNDWECYETGEMLENYFKEKGIII